MNTPIIDLIGDNAVSIGTTYSVSFQLCSAPDLTLYSGASQIKVNNLSPEIILSPIVNVITKDLFELTIPYGLFTSNIQAGNYQYDVLFTRPEDRFYAVAGKIQLIKRITQISS